MAKQSALFVVLLVCACPCTATRLSHPACANICRSYTRDDVNYRHCVIACSEASANEDTADDVGYFYPSEIPNYFQNGEDVTQEHGSDCKTVDYYDPIEENRDQGDDYEVWPPSGSLSKWSSPGIWKKETENDPTGHGLSFVKIGRPNLLFGVGKSPRNEVQKRASSFVRIGRTPFRTNVGQAGPFFRLRKAIEEDEMSSDPTMELEYMPSSTIRVRKSLSEKDNKRANSFIRIGTSQNQQEVKRTRTTKRASSFVRIGKSPVDEENGSIPFAELAKPRNYNDEKRVADSSFVRVGKSPLDEEEKRASSFVRIGKSPLNEEGKRASSFVRIGKSLLDEEEKRASSFVRIGKSPLDEEEKRASSFVRIGKSPIDEKEKRASSFVRIGKSPLDEEEKRASSFVRIGKSSLVEDEKRASSFVRIGKSPLNEEEKRASSFVRIGKSPLDEEEKRASSFVRIGKSPLDEEEKRASSFVRIGKSPIDEEEKRASSFVRIGKSPIDEEEKRASSFVRIGKSPKDEEEKRASSFVRIGKSSFDEENESTSFAEIGKQPSFADKGSAHSLFRRIGKPPVDEKGKQASSFTVRIGGTLEPEFDEFQMKGHNQSKRYNAYLSLRKRFQAEGDLNKRKLLRIPRPAVESVLDQTARVAPLLSNRKVNRILYIPVNDEEQSYPDLNDPVQDTFHSK